MIPIEDLTDVTLAIEDTDEVMKMMKKTWLMWPWWVMIPIEDLTDATLAIEDTDEYNGLSAGLGHMCPNPSSADDDDEGGLGHTPPNTHLRANGKK